MNLRKLPYVALAGGLLVLQPLRPYVVSGDSMSPNLANGQLVFGNVRVRRVARGDIVVFRHGGETMVKRVAFLPGDRIEAYRFLGEWKTPLNAFMRRAMVRQGLPRHDEVVPPDRVYVMGDNVRFSVDSRSFGTIPMGDVVAVVRGVETKAALWRPISHETARLVALR